MKIKIIKPSVGLHDGSSFRELLDMWDELGYCEVVAGDIPPQPWKREETQLVQSRPWVSGIGKVLLYDNPILDKLHSDLKWEMSLWSNEVKKDENCYPWIFWPKHSKIHYKFIQQGIKKHSERNNESVFIGSFTTQKRSGSWHTSIQNYWMGRPGGRALNNSEYLDALSHHKFGLCLPGVGPKCLRDIELIGLGTVPIFTPGVSTDYYRPLIKDKHFLYAESPQEIRNAIESCDKEKWNYISNNCVEWYDENCSPLGSFKTTMQIIEENYKGNL